MLAHAQPDSRWDLVYTSLVFWGEEVRFCRELLFSLYVTDLLRAKGLFSDFHARILVETKESVWAFPARDAGNGKVNGEWH